MLKLIALGFKLRQSRARLLHGFAHLRNTGLITGVANIALERAHFNSACLHFFVGGGPRFLRLSQFHGDGVGQLVARTLPIRHATDDQRCARLVNQNAVHLVHDGEVVRSLHLILGAGLHVVAQIIKTKFRRGAVENIAAVRGAFLILSLHMLRMNRTHG